MGLCVVTVRMWSPMDIARQVAEAALEKAKSLGASLESVVAVHCDATNTLYDYRTVAQQESGATSRAAGA